MGPRRADTTEVAARSVRRRRMPLEQAPKSLNNELCSVIACDADRDTPTNPTGGRARLEACNNTGDSRPAAVIVAQHCGGRQDRPRTRATPTACSSKAGGVVFALEPLDGRVAHSARRTHGISPRGTHGGYAQSAGTETELPFRRRLDRAGTTRSARCISGGVRQTCDVRILHTSCVRRPESSLTRTCWSSGARPCTAAMTARLFLS